MAMRCSLEIPWAVGLASVYPKAALISVPAAVEIRAAVGRTPISPTETTLAAKSPLVGRVDHSGSLHPNTRASQRPYHFPRSPPLVQPAIRASNCREAYIRRRLCWVNRSSAHNGRQNCRTADFVAFRVPANPDDPAPRRLLIARVEGPLALQGPYCPVSTTTTACSERRCTSSGGVLPSPGYVKTYNPPFRSSFIFAPNSVRQTKSCGRLTSA